MAIFLTGSTGYIGAHVAANLLDGHGAALNVLVRAREQGEAQVRLWNSLQLHLDFPRFYEYLQTRVRVFCGDLTSPAFGLGRDDYDRLVHTTDSVIHCAASLNRKSEKSCLNVNLRGTLEVLTLARHAEHYHGLRRFSQVSTVAVCGKRHHEVVTEDRSIEWDRSDYDPYARTKKFCEHMMRVLLPDTPKTVFRPSIVLGDSRYAETTQFDMVRSFVFLAGLPALPFRPTDKIDIVNVDFVADAIATLHQKDQPQYDTYHLSSGLESQTFRQLTSTLAAAQNKRGPVFLPFLEKPFSSAVNFLANRKGPVGHGAALMKVFLPYLVWNTVFDNTRVTTELGRKPVPFSRYSYPLLKFSRENHFEYRYKPWPAAAGGTAA
ncbi:MAG TPA: SDR family oxidoreductase [Candidatus Sulfotelmatobacter sp.]|nr:SDR family oxidoreductase [Candidatus Sulfotelmatobacter sp.]